MFAGYLPVRAVDKLVDVLAIFVIEHLRVEFEDGNDQLDSLHRYVVLLVECH